MNSFQKTERTINLWKMLSYSASELQVNTTVRIHPAPVRTAPRRGSPPLIPALRRLRADKTTFQDQVQMLSEFEPGQPGLHNETLSQDKQ